MAYGIFYCRDLVCNCTALEDEMNYTLNEADRKRLTEFRNDSEGLKSFRYSECPNCHHKTAANGNLG
jgi:hypothetical protein